MPDVFKLQAIWPMYLVIYFSRDLNPRPRKFAFKTCSELEHKSVVINDLNDGRINYSDKEQPAWMYLEIVFK